MPLIAKYSLKLFAGKHGGLTRFTALVAVICIAAGTFGLIFAQAITRGLRAEIQEKILENSPHIAIFSLDGTPISDHETLKKMIGEISSVSFVSGAIYEPAVIDPANPRPVTLRIEENIDGLNDGEILIGKELADAMNLAPQSIVKLTVFNDAGEIKTNAVRVANVFNSGVYEYDSTWIKMSPATYTHLAAHDIFTPKVLNIKLLDLYQAASTVNEIKKITGNKYRVIDWTEANKPLFVALDLERRAAIAVILLIIFIAMINIITTLSLVAREKRFDIAVLRVCGVAQNTLSAMIVLNGVIIAVIGAGLGVILGLTSCYLVNTFGLLKLDPQVYFIDQITLKPTLFDVLIISIGSIIVATIVSIFPAKKAVTTKPAVIFREN